MLQGNLSDFSLSDIFQLITLTKKSGSLSIDNGQAQGRILFHSGEVAFAVADSARIAIGARLVQAGLASDERVIQILERSRAAGETGNLSQALLEGIDVDQDALDAFIRASIEDAVFSLMRLTSATYSFDAAEEDAGVVGSTVSTEHLILEGRRRMGEWSAIRELIPASEAVLAVCPAAADDGQVTLTAQQWRVLALLDGRRTVREVVDLAGQGEFTVSQVLAGMVEAGLVQVTASDGAGALSDLFERRERLQRIEALELGGPVTTGPGRAPAQRPPAAETTRQPAPRTAPASTERREPVLTEAPAAEPVAPRQVPAPPSGGPTPDHGATTDRPPLRPGAVAAPAETTPTPIPAPAEPTVASSTLHRAVVPEPGPPAETTAMAVGDAHEDSSSIASELAALGRGASRLRGEATPAAGAAGEAGEEVRRLTRDEDVNQGLLLRLIDGVKGA